MVRAPSRRHRVSAAILLAACSGLPDPDPELTSRLETCATEADQEQLLRARVLLDQGRQGEAIESLRALSSRNPDCALLVVNLRKAMALAPLFADGDFEKEPLAEVPSDAVIDLEETRDRYEKLYGELLDSRDNLAFAVALFSSGDRERRRWLDLALDWNPRHYFALILSGEHEYRTGRYDLAKTDIKKALALNGQIAEGWLLLAQIADEQGNYRTADKHYRTYLELRPLDRKVRHNYVRFLIKSLRDGKRARAHVDEMLLADPDSLESGLHLGAVHWIAGDAERAEEVYLELLRRFPNEARICLNLGDLYYSELKRPAKAWKTYKYLLSLPVDSDPYAMLGQLLFVPNRIKELERRLGAPLPEVPRSIEDLR